MRKTSVYTKMACLFNLHRDINSPKIFNPNLSGGEQLFSPVSPKRLSILSTRAFEYRKPNKEASWYVFKAHVLLDQVASGAGSGAGASVAPAAL